MAALVILVVFLALCTLNVPIAVALGAVAMGAMVIDLGTAGLMNAAIVMFEGARKFPLIAIPLFVLAGGIMNATSISRRLIQFCSALIGFVRGGLSMVSIVASMFFAEISGSAVADVAALGSVLIPEMKRRGYPKELAASVMSSAASLAIIIPPSIPMILYAVIADTSVVKLFVAGIVPGIIGGLSLMGVAYWHAHRLGLPSEGKFHLANVWRRFREAGLALLLPVIILGGIFGGVVTATEGRGAGGGGGAGDRPDLPRNST
jgi:C4-dicarboxylate transporter DctM subunit